MKNIIQLFGQCCSYILSLALLNAFTDVLNHFYTGLRKRYFKQWGKNSVISTDIYKGERYNDTCMAEVNFFCNNSWLFGELNGKILQYDKDAK